MARPLRDGVEYFPFDVGMLRDPKVKLIKGEFGALGVYVFLTVLCSAYEENGYFKEWSDDVCILVADEVGCGCNFGTVAEIMKGCVRRSLFDEGVLNAFGVLTSAGIQRRFLRAASQRDDIPIFQEYWLLDIDNRKDVPVSIRNKIAFKSVTTGRNPDKTCFNPDKTPDNPQSKVKERKEKVKESKGKEVSPEGHSPPALPAANVVIELILNDGSLHQVLETSVKQWTELYPAVNVMQELRKMKGWCDSNPRKRKTKRGVNGFINNWLAREQDKGGSRHGEHRGHTGANTESQFTPSTGFKRG